MWRGAKIGAVSLGLVGFVSGITVCVAYHLPIPPIAVTEIAALLGGCLGATAGYACCYTSGRATLKGSLTGALLGLPMAGLLQGQLSVPIWLACITLASLIGYQAACTPQPTTKSPWKPAKDPAIYKFPIWDPTAVRTGYSPIPANPPSPNLLNGDGHPCSGPLPTEMAP